jgi:hypothetical protein
MSYVISNSDELTFTIVYDLQTTWVVPKFRCLVVVDEPYATLYWTDTEKGSSGITRSVVMDYNDVLFGVYAPSSAAEVKTLIDALIIKAWTDIWANFANYVPYTGANQNVDLGVYGLTADYVEFDLNPVSGAGAGKIVYDGQTGSLTYLLNNSNVPSHIGQTLHAYVHNAEAVTINKGEAVYLYEATGNKASVKLAYNTSDATSAKTFGLAAEDISAGGQGMVITVGQLQGVNTAAFSEGDTLYLGATAGTYTNVKPYAPNHLVYVGIVEKANANGEIYVRVQNGYELDEIHDVDLITTPPTNGDVLTYNGTLWVAQAPSGGTGTVTSIATTSPITGGTITTSGTIGINNAAADGSTKGAAAFTASDFNDNGSGVISIDYTNGQAANGSTKGFLTSADWTTFNGKQDLLVSGTNIKTVNGITLLGSGDVDIHGLTINVQALTSSPADGATIYFGTLPKAPVTVAATSKIFIRKAGTIKHAEIYCYSGTAGSAESWSLYIRKNNTTDTLIATVAAATNERVFSNSSLSISMAVGDYFEIKAINPTWGTNPLTTIFGGYIYIE